jgi:hypothetical protein
LSALLYGRNDSALWSCCGLVCSGHVVPLSYVVYIRHICS